MFGEKGKPTRRHLWVATWIGAGATLVACVVPPAEASEDLVGLDEQRAIELLGPPATTEDRAPARIWHYKSSHCELDLVFYMEMHTGRMRTLHYDFKSGADNATQRRVCLTSIAQKNSEGPPGNNLSEKDVVAEAPNGKGVPPTAVEIPSQKLPPASEPKQQASRREPYVPRGYGRHRPRRYAARGRKSGVCAGAKWSQPDAAGVPVLLCN
jgi:hypothetical protein